MRQSGWVSTSNLLILSIIILLMVVLAVGNPYADTWFLKCPLHTFTGWQCPLCGMQRQFHALMHLQLLEAWRLNPVLLLTSPYWLLLLWGQISPKFRTSKLGNWCYDNKVLLFFIILLVCWGVARNL